MGACLGIAVGLLYLGARETPVFALTQVEVLGAPREVRQAVLQEVASLRGDSLVALDGGALVRRLEAIPSVKDVTYDRAFPHTLRLFVEPEQPVAVLKQGGQQWVVSVRGRVLRVAGQADRALTKVRYLGEEPLADGGFVPPGSTTILLEALAQAPDRSELPIHSGRFEDGALTFTLAGDGGERPLLELGEPADVALKLRVAALVLANLSAEERATLAYLDVSLPDRPVASADSQVSG